MTLACDLSRNDSIAKRSAELSETTTMHGIPNATRTKNLIRRVLWVAITLAGICVTIWQITLLVIKYYEYGTDTKVTITYNTTIKFPAVTICNMNPIRDSALYLAGTDLFGLLGPPPVNEQNQNSTNGTTSTPPTNKKPVQSWDDKQNVSNYFDEVDTRYQTRLNSIYYLNSLDDATRHKLGHNISWMLLDCSYSGYPCSPENFTSFLHYQYGLCYTFNSGKKRTLDASKPGPIYGLSMELYIEQDEYIPELADTAGVRLVVHPQRSMPFPEDDGVTIAPGTSTSVSLTLLEITRVEKPYGNCKSYTDADNKKYNVFTEFQHMKVDYTDRACLKTCYQRSLILNCSCCSSFYPCAGEALREALSGRNVSICNGSHASCLVETDGLFAEGKLGCDAECKPSCNEQTFTTSNGFGAYPALPSMDEVFDRLIAKDEQLNDLLYDFNPGQYKEFIRDNVLRVEIFFQKLNYEQIVTTPAYSVESMLSDMGGQVGLWLGLSVITLFEFLEYFFDIIVITLLKLSRNGETVAPLRKKEELHPSPISRNNIALLEVDA